jgi:hypothetical protein
MVHTISLPASMVLFRQADKANMKMATPFANGGINHAYGCKSLRKGNSLCRGQLMRDSHDARVVNETTLWYRSI